MMYICSCRGIVESSCGRGAIELGREVGFRDEGGSDVGMSKSLPSFGSHNGEETLRAAIIHYKAIFADYSDMSFGVHALRRPVGRLIKASGPRAYRRKPNRLSYRVLL